MDKKEKDLIKLPRFFIDTDLCAGKDFRFEGKQAHYLANVLRRKNGDPIRVFNGRNGEWLAEISTSGKKSVKAHCLEQLRPQPDNTRSVHLYFAPIKKKRMSWLVEKAVELGATHLHPVLTQNTEVRAINRGKTGQYIQNAAEQSERLEMPILEEIRPLRDVIAGDNGTEPLLVCLERVSGIPVLTQNFPSPSDNIHILIGPEGGFTEEERDYILSAQHARAVNLGPFTLRCETAVCVSLGAILLNSSI